MYKLSHLNMRSLRRRKLGNVGVHIVLALQRND